MGLKWVLVWVVVFGCGGWVVFLGVGGLGAQGGYVGGGEGVGEGEWMVGFVVFCQVVRAASSSRMRVGRRLWLGACRERR
ncbi:Uncharacterised protein [Dermatophilus congolensis]|uniref:Uncharacterized protein n=1 Tax=Dermatophilus congolensis TaxID=1863 RepID=A0AA46H193_9MICO|nr:Uncharacterised protein [Dermatophilus congolensis]